MVWFGKQTLIYAIYLPATLAAMVAPYALTTGRGMDLPTTLLGTSLAQSALAVAITRGAGLGSGAIFAIWAAAGVLAACCAAALTRPRAQVWLCALRPSTCKHFNGG